MDSWHWTRIVMLGACVAASSVMLGCISGPAQREAKLRWDQYQQDDRAAEQAMREGRVEEGVAIYQRLWREAAAPNRPPGSPLVYFVGLSMAEMGNRAPRLRARWAELLPETEARAAVPSATWREIDALLELTYAAKQDEPLVRQAAAASLDRKRLRIWRTNRWVSEEAQRRLRSAERPDLAAAVARTPCQRVGDVAGDAVSLAAGALLGPTLGPFVAPR